MQTYEPMEPVPDLQRVVCAANRNKHTGVIILGARHWDMPMRAMVKGSDDEFDTDFDKTWLDAEQGFIDQWGNFLTREAAYVIAERMDQLKGKGAPHTPGRLYSEDLY